MTKRSGELVSAAEAAERRLTEQETAPVPALSPEGTDAAALMGIIQQLARSPEFDTAKLRELLAIKTEWEREEARKAFIAALARAQAGMPIVRKNRHVYFKNRQDVVTDYWHADYGNLVDTIKPYLSAEGLSYDHVVIQEGDKITVRCILSHELGHSKDVEMTAPPDDSGGKNKIQQIKSTTTYLKRSTLEAVTGAATEDDDDDGRGYDDADLINTVELAALNAEIEEVGANRADFIAYLNKALGLQMRELDELPAYGYQTARQGLEAKRSQIAKSGEAEDERGA